MTHNFMSLEPLSYYHLDDLLAIRELAYHIIWAKAGNTVLVMSIDDRQRNRQNREHLEDCQNTTQCIRTSVCELETISPQTMTDRRLFFEVSY